MSTRILAALLLVLAACSPTGSGSGGLGKCSACKYCPNNTLEEWEELRDTDAEGFADALTMSRNAEPLITAPDVVGLMRCNPHGRRQLHVWAAGGYSGAPRTGDAEDSREAQPCECAL